MASQKVFKRLAGQKTVDSVQLRGEINITSTRAGIYIFTFHTSRPPRSIYLSTVSIYLSLSNYIIFSDQIHHISCQLMEKRTGLNINFSAFLSITVPCAPDPPPPLNSVLPPFLTYAPPEFSLIERLKIDKDLC